MPHDRGNGHSRVNAYAAKWCEIAAGHRFRLDLADENVCDAYATADTPGVAEGTPVEVKGCMVWIGNGPGERMHGRFTFSSTHERLVEAGGMYAFVVYELVDNVVVARRLGLIPASAVDTLLPDDADYPKLGWHHVFDPDRV